MKRSWIGLTLFIIVEALACLSNSVHEDVEVGRVLASSHGRLIKRGFTKRPAPSSSPEINQSRGKRQRQQVSPQPQSSPRVSVPASHYASSSRTSGSESLHGKSSNSGILGSKPSRSGRSNNKSLNSRRSKSSPSGNRSPNHGALEPLSSWHSSSSSSGKGSPDSSNSQASITSSPATSQQKRYPVSVSTMTRGPAIIASSVGRTLQQEIQLQRVASGERLSVVATHPKKAMIDVEHLSPQALTHSISRGRNPRLEALPETGNNPVLTTMIPHRQKPLQIHKGVIDGSDPNEHEHYSQSYKKGAHIIGTFEGKGFVRAEAQNSLWKVAPI